MYNVKKDSNLIHPHIDSVLSARFAEKPAIPVKRVLLESTQVYTGTFTFAVQMYIYLSLYLRYHTVLITVALK